MELPFCGNLCLEKENFGVDLCKLSRRVSTSFGELSDLPTQPDFIQHNWRVCACVCTCVRVRVRVRACLYACMVRCGVHKSAARGRPPAGVFSMSTVRQKV